MEEHNKQQQAIIKAEDTSSVLKVRLDTAPLIEQYEVFLTGQIQTIAYDKENKPFIELKTIAEPKANGEGIQWILNKLRLIVNPSTVQGNFITNDMYYNYLFNIHSSLLYNLMVNKYVWGIKDQDYEPIIDNFMDIIYVFMTRPLANKERESYGQTMRVAESSIIDQKRRGFSLNPFNKVG